MLKECLHTDFALQTDLTPLERKVLIQYQNLALKLYKLSDELKKIHQRRSDLALNDFVAGQAHALLQNMRGLERKTGLVYTQFRTAVYALQLQNEEIKEQTKNSDEGILGNLESPIGVGNPVRQLESDDEGTTILTYEEN